MCLVLQRYPMFTGATDLENLCQIAAVLGADRVVDASRECGKVVRFPEWVPRKGVKLSDFTAALNPTRKDKVIDDSAYDLLDKMLEPYPGRRITAREALAHPFLYRIKK